MRAQIFGGVVVVGLFAAGAALAQGSITTGDVHFVRETPAFGALPNASFTGAVNPASQDQLYQFGWWARLANGSQETPFGTPSSQDYSAVLSSTISWGNVAGTGLNATETTSIADGLAGGHPEDGGVVTAKLELDNLTLNPISVALFFYADLDMAGTGGEDVAYLGEAPRLIRVQEGSNYAELRSLEASAFAGGTFSAIRGGLNDASASTLSDSGLPFGPDDFAAALQFNLEIPAFGQSEVTVYLAINYSLHCAPPFLIPSKGLFCDGFEVNQNRIWSWTQL